MAEPPSPAPSRTFEALEIVFAEFDPVGGAFLASIPPGGARP
jgi:hypothetical protein